MVQVVRKDKEPVGSLLRRFTRKTQQSGLLIEARKSRYHRRDASAYKQRQSALRRIKIKDLYRKLIKLGVLEEGKEVPQQLKRKHMKGEKVGGW
jgi:ribosomal protein S21